MTNPEQYTSLDENTHLPISIAEGHQWDIDNPVHSPGRKEYYEVLLQETQRKLDEEHETLNYFLPIMKRLRDESHTDELTRTNNLRGLLRWGNEVYDEKMFKDEKYRACIVVFDLSGFKYVNDYLSHKVGDDVLSIVPEVFKSSVRVTTDTKLDDCQDNLSSKQAKKSDDITERDRRKNSNETEDYVFGRIGGDEFMLVLDIGSIQNGHDVDTELDDEELIAFIEKNIIQRIKEDFGFVTSNTLQSLRTRMEEKDVLDDFVKAKPLAVHHNIVLNREGEYFNTFIERATADVSKIMKDRTRK